jgi:hypothetical protein
VLGVNVRAYQPGTDRRRGGQRSGLQRYVDAAAVPDWLIQEIGTVVGTGYPPPGGGASMQTSSSGRVVTLYKVQQGNIYVTNPGSGTWSVAANATGQSTPLNYTGVVRSTSINQKVYFADGRNQTYYDPATHTAYRWNVTAGAFPADDKGNLPRLICTWRGRCVLSGIINDPQNWFMSKVSDPHDFNYFPDPVTADMAVAGNNSSLGLVGDVVTTLIPWSDDLLIIGCDHEIWLMKGDPAFGGQLDCVTRTIGMAFGVPWAIDPQGTVYFVSNKMGIYAMKPGEQPLRISQPIEQLVAAYNTGTTTIRAVWNDRHQGVHFFFSPTSAPALTTHLFFDARTGGWWPDQFARTDFDPLCCCTFDGNEPEDRTVLIGSWDGYVRTLTTDAVDDDGYPVASRVFIGPLNSKTLDEMQLRELQGELADDSGEVTYRVYVGSTAEAALASSPVAEGLLRGGRNRTNPVRRSGHAMYVELAADNAWALERIRVTLAQTGKVRRRA